MICKRIFKFKKADDMIRFVLHLCRPSSIIIASFLNHLIFPKLAEYIESTRKVRRLADYFFEYTSIPPRLIFVFKLGSGKIVFGKAFRFGNGSKIRLRRRPSLAIGSIVFFVFAFFIISA